MDAMLPTIWAGILAFAILVYVVLDGFDLGIGMLFGTTGNEIYRRQMMASVAPVWDGNETWLLVVGAGLFGAFPMVYAIFLSALYLPVILLLIALIFRGVAFEFRYKSEKMRWLWDWGFFLGSGIATFVQGAAIGAMVNELPIEDGRFVGSAFFWLTPVRDLLRHRPDPGLLPARRDLADPQDRRGASRLGLSPGAVAARRRAGVPGGGVRLCAGPEARRDAALARPAGPVDLPPGRRGGRGGLPFRHPGQARSPCPS